MKIFNDMDMQLEEFQPIEPGKVKMYACGPTVYNYIHVGNARPIVIFDVLRRYLEYRGYEVTFVQNFTDVDDKMIRKAEELGITVKELAEQYIGEYFVDAKGLGIREATVHPRATENIDAIIALVQNLIDNGYAYEVDGDVYYSTKKFKEYGKLSHQPLEDLESGARIDINEDKADPMDFALWKKQKPGEIAWESPWGMGRAEHSAQRLGRAAARADPRRCPSHTHPQQRRRLWHVLGRTVAVPCAARGVLRHRCVGARAP